MYFDMNTNATLNGAGHALHINRDEPCHIFKKIIQQIQDQQTLNIHGPAGIGKSALLTTFKQIAKEHDAHFTLVDIQLTDKTKNSLVEALATNLGSGPSLHECIEHIHGIAQSRTPIIAIDHCDEFAELNQWLENEFFTQLPHKILLIFVSRARPLNQQQNITNIQLSNFSYQQIQHYLSHYGIEDKRILSQVWHYTKGLPLALSLITNAITTEGPHAITHMAKRTDILDQLVQHWLKEISQEKLTLLVDAASILRCFNQDLLNHVTQQTISTERFTRLINTSIVSSDKKGWALHDVARETIARQLKHRSPLTYNEMRARALQYFGDIATRPGEHKERSAALQELFYMLGDGLVRAALYEPQGYDPEPLHMETATPADFDDVTDYMDEWRNHRNQLTGTKLAFYDQDKQNINQHWIAAEPCEPDLIDINGIITKSAGAVRLLRGADNTLRGLSIILPINRLTIDELSQQPVTRHYFQGLDTQEKTALTTPPGETINWFVRLVDVRNEEDHQARATLLKELTNQLTRPAQFITSTPLPFYQSLLMRFGFTQLDIEPHNDFGTNRSAPYFALDLRGDRFVHHIQQMISMQAGDGKLATLSSQLAAMINQQASRQKEELKQYQIQLFAPLTKREREVALCTVDGLANIPIARKLNVTEVTIKKHLGRVFCKLNIANRGELMRRYLDSDYKKHPA